MQIVTRNLPDWDAADAFVDGAGALAPVSATDASRAPRRTGVFVVEAFGEDSARLLAACASIFGAMSRYRGTTLRTWAAPDGRRAALATCALRMRPGPEAAVVLAARVLEIESGRALGENPLDDAALGLLRSLPLLAEEWPWTRPSLSAGKFVPATGGKAPSGDPVSISHVPSERRPPSRYQATEWTPDRISVLRAMWSRGAIASEIAEALGDVSKSAVIGKLTRLGLTGGGIVHRNPRRKGGRPTHRRQPAPEARA